MVIGTLAGTALGAGATFLTQLLQERRAAQMRIKEVQRRVYLEFLSEIHGLFLAVRAARLEHRNADAGPASLRERLALVDPHGAQSALDQVRLSAPAATVACAEAAFFFVRAVDPKINRGMSWNAWHSEYRGLRKAFIEQARLDLAR